MLAAVHVALYLHLQHRFLDPALRIGALGVGAKLAARFGVPEEAIKEGTGYIKGIFGDELRKF